MTFDAARPRYTLPLPGREVELIGTMELIEAVEYALKRGAVQVAVEVVEGMTSMELARLLAAILTACGHKMSVTEASGLLWSEIGLSGDSNQILRLHLYSFLSICLAPPEQREAKAKNAGELMGKLQSASPG